MTCQWFKYTCTYVNELSKVIEMFWVSQFVIFENYGL